MIRHQYHYHYHYHYHHYQQHSSIRHTSAFNQIERDI